MTLLHARERRDKHGLRPVERKWEKREVVEGVKEEKKRWFSSVKFKSSFIFVEDGGL